MLSRRDALGTVAAGVAVALAGCGQLRGTDAAGDATDAAGDDATQAASDGATQTTAAPSFALELVGPEDRRTLFTEADTAQVGEVRQQGSNWFVSVELTASATTAVSETFETAGVTDDTAAFEAVIRVEDETINRFGFTPSFASAVVSGEYDGSFVLTFGEEDAATRARRALTAE